MSIELPTKDLHVPTTPEAIPQSTRERLQRTILAKRDVIVEGWFASQFDEERLRRFGVQSTGMSQEETQNTFLYPLLALLAAYVGSGDVALRAVYLDERLRYAPHRAAPAVRAQFFREVLQADEAVLLRAVADREASEGLQDILNHVHSSLLGEASASPVRLLALGDCLMNEIRVFLPEECRQNGDQLDMRCLYFSARMGRDLATEPIIEFLKQNTMDLIAMSFLSYEGIPAYTSLLRDAPSLKDADIAPRVSSIIGIMRRFMEELRAFTDAPFLLHNASGLPLTRWRRRIPLLSPMHARTRRVLQILNASIEELAQNVPNTLLIDERAVAADVGLRRAGKAVVPHHIAKNANFHTARLGSDLSAPYASIVRSFETTRRTKVLLLDFDNTLWSGVMAEGPVEHYHDRQSLLRRLREGGMLLVAVSKNDPAAIRWDEMTLKPEDFVLQKISWDLKVKSIQEVADHLDLGLDSFLFIDDNPVERELVDSQLPKVRTLDALDSSTWQTVGRLLSFPNTRETDEAKQRTELYRQQALRKEALASEFDYPAMMAGLGLRLHFGRASEADLPRVLELVQRTNQFNTTTIRYSKEQLIAFIKGTDRIIYVASLDDKFGSIGLVAVAIVERKGLSAVFESFIMSCRAMGFQLEQSVLALVCNSENQAGEFVGKFVPTDRNTPAMDLFAKCGFSEENGEWHLNAASADMRPASWFHVSRR